MRGPVPGRLAQQGMKRSVLVDADGMPLGRVLIGANRHDSVVLPATLDLLNDLGPLPEEITVHLDAGYDSAKTRDELAACDLTGRIAHKGEKAPIQASQRWPVERTNRLAQRVQPAPTLLRTLRNRHRRLPRPRRRHHHPTTHPPRLDHPPLGHPTHPTPMNRNSPIRASSYAYSVGRNADPFGLKARICRETCTSQPAYSAARDARCVPGSLPDQARPMHSGGHRVGTTKSGPWPTPSRAASNGVDQCVTPSSFGGAFNVSATTAR